MSPAQAGELLDALPPATARSLGRAGRRVLLAILTARWIWTRVAGIASGHRGAERLVRRGLCVLWGTESDSLQVTLTIAGVELLGVAVEEFPTVAWSSTTDGETGERVSIQELQAFDRWVPAGQLKGYYSMPRARGVADYRPDDLPARPAPVDSDLSVELDAGALLLPVSISGAERRKILGVFVEPLRRRSKSKGKPRRRAG